MKGALILALLFVALVRAGDDLDLDESNFQSTIESNDYVLAMFFAPWCGHCKNFKPHFAEAATKAKGKYVLAKIDCTLDSAKALCQEQEVRGYPTIKFFKKGVPQEYNGPRDVSGVLNWLEKKTGPAAVTLTSRAEVTDFLEKNKNSVRVIGYFDQVGSDAHADFIKAASDADVEDFKFATVVGLSGHKDNSVNLYVAGSDEAIPHPSEHNLARWAFENHFPLLDEVGGHNFAKYSKLGKPLHLAFIEPTDANLEEYKAALTKVAHENRDESFSWIDASKYKAQIKNMGGSGNVIPLIIRLSSFGSDNKPIVFEEKFTAPSIAEWVKGIKAGTVKYVPKSEPVPESNDGPVKTIVGSQWDEIVNDSTKNVLVEFYAPWCGHCKSLAPKYEELGAGFSGSKDIVIAKIDGTANDVDSHLDIKGFPTIALYTKNGKSTPIVYEGEREVASLQRFISENSK